MTEEITYMLSNMVGQFFDNYYAETDNTDLRLTESIYQ